MAPCCRHIQPNSHRGCLTSVFYGPQFIGNTYQEVIFRLASVLEWPSTFLHTPIPLQNLYQAFPPPWVLPVGEEEVEQHPGGCVKPRGTLFPTSLPPFPVCCPVCCFLLFSRLAVMSLRVRWVLLFSWTVGIVASETPVPFDLYYRHASHLTGLGLVSGNSN